MEAKLKAIYAGFPEGVKKVLRPILRNYWYLRHIIRLPYYSSLFNSFKGAPINLVKFEEKIYSEQGEDGILLAIFKKIGTTNKFVVDFGAGDGVTCNSGFLVKHKKWNSLQMDFLTIGAPRVKTEKISAENIEELFKKYSVPEEFDLLTIDTDFNDYWIWKAITHFSPRVVVLEYNPAFSYDESMVVEYDVNGWGDNSSYFGASLLAYSKLGKEKGYTLVACTSKGMNCFFVRNDLVENNFLLKPLSAYYTPTEYRESPSGKKMIAI